MEEIKMSTLISVIIPVHDENRYLPELFASLEKQTFSDFEVILVDDGSSDGSYATCENQSVFDYRFHVYHNNRNYGVSHARNIGLANAKGAYLTFVDADDVIDKDYLSVLYATMVQYRADVVTCHYVTDEKKLTRHYGANVKPMTESHFMNSIYLNDRDNHVWGRLYRKSVVAGHTFDENFGIAEDLVFLLNLVKDMSLSMCLVDYKGYFHRINKEGLLSSYPSEHCLRVINQLYRLYISDSKTADEKKLILHRLIRLMHDIVKNKNLDDTERQHLSELGETIRVKGLLLPSVSLSDKLFLLFGLAKPMDSADVLKPNRSL
jgi:glycosyltransferase involved in cell wall biosynthesis